MPIALEYKVRLRRPHQHQAGPLDSSAKRVIIRAGRRGGKTVAVGIKSVQAFLAGKRVLYATPTADQLDAWWYEVKRALAEPLDAGVYAKNETEHSIEFAGTKTRLRGKTAWNADMLRGDFADFLALDEYQLMCEDTWELVGAPMLLDNDGDAWFIYTPPSLRSRSVSKARDPRHAAKMFAKAQADISGRWAAFHFRSQDNPYLSPQALAEIAQDMSNLAYRQEILAEDVDEAPGALWTRVLLEDTRVNKAPELARVAIGIDPPGGVAEAGIVCAGKGKDGQFYILADASLKASPDIWAGRALELYAQEKADRIVAEANFGGDMVKSTIEQAARARGITAAFKLVNASRGKAVRAEPVVALFEQRRAHLVGSLPALEDEMTMWIPGEGASPNRMDAMVWAVTELMGSHSYACGVA